MNFKNNVTVPLSEYLFAIKKDLSLENRNFQENLETIPMLLDLHPLSSYVTPTFYRLVDAFVISDNKIKLRILNICKSCRHHFDAITDFNYISTVLYRPLYSNDDYARVLNANLLALFCKYTAKDDVIVEIVKENIYSPDPIISQTAFSVMADYPSPRVTITFFKQLIDVCCTLSISVVNINNAFEKFLSEIYLRTKSELDMYLLKFIVWISVGSYKKMDTVLSKVLEHIEVSDDNIKRRALIELIQKYLEGSFSWPKHIIYQYIEVIETLMSEGEQNYKLVFIMIKYLTKLKTSNVSGVKIIFEFLDKYITLDVQTIKTDIAYVYYNIFTQYSFNDYCELVNPEKLIFLLNDTNVESEVAFKALRSYVIGNTNVGLRHELFQLCINAAEEAKSDDKINLAFSVMKILLYFEPTLTQYVVPFAMRMINLGRGLHLKSFYQVIYCVGLNETVPCEAWLLRMDTVEPSLLYEIAIFSFINGHWSVSSYLVNIIQKLIDGLTQKSIIILNIIKLISNSAINNLMYNEIENSIDNQELAVGTFEEILGKNDKSRNVTMIIEFLKVRARVFKMIMSTVAYFDESHVEIIQDHNDMIKYQKYLHEELQYDIIELDDYLKTTDTLISQTIDADYETRLQLKFLNEQIMFLKSLLLLLIGDNVVEYVDVIKEREKDYTEVLLNNGSVTGFSVYDIESLDTYGFEKIDDKMDTSTINNDDKDTFLSSHNETNNSYKPTLWGKNLFYEDKDVVMKNSDVSNTENGNSNVVEKDLLILDDKSNKLFDYADIGLTKNDIKYIQSRLKQAGAIKYQNSLPEHTNTKVRLHSSVLFIRYLGKENWDKCLKLASIIEKSSPKNLKEFLQYRDSIYECISCAFTDYKVMIPFIFYKRSNTVVQLDICPKEEIDVGIYLPEGGISINIEAIINFTTIHYKFSKIELELSHYEDDIFKKSIIKEGSKSSDSYFKETFFLNIEKNGCLKMILSAVEARSERCYQLAERCIYYKTTKE
ncbi:Armadillo-type fold domain-containing protein [Strongyloides ratti]|uniref:Armadillo-type fold domain-containing protein n=1 Tax=Strongyloides ratti TaxID=34506 RepID=A0A090MZZ7_STRRB|nr:Armadillo-type fold domain-containing protein [Strongyloides ratti]CEF69805.1 Armadillo-type fold domain-containing protein [Strongyloides ratti]